MYSTGRPGFDIKFSLVASKPAGKNEKAVAVKVALTGREPTVTDLASLDAYFHLPTSGHVGVRKS